MRRNRRVLSINRFRVRGARRYRLTIKYIIISYNLGLFHRVYFPYLWVIVVVVVVVVVIVVGESPATAVIGKRARGSGRICRTCGEPRNRKYETSRVSDSSLDGFRISFVPRGPSGNEFDATVDDRHWIELSFLKCIRSALVPGRIFIPIDFLFSGVIRSCLRWGEW